MRTFQTEEQFFAILASGPQNGAEGKAKATLMADRAASMLAGGVALDTVVETVLAALANGEHMPFSILQVLGGWRAHLVECDAPPLFLTRGGQLVLLPVLEDISHGRLVRKCQFPLQNGDHMAMVSEGFIRARGWGRRWGWRDIAVSTRRWTDTGCDAEQLLGALVRTYRRLAVEEPERDVTVVAMHVRPERRATVWTGPPADPAEDEVALERLMAVPGMRVICGDTTAQIAARLLGADLELEPRPEDGWAEVPPVSRLEGIDLVTEGLVTLSKARERMAGAERVRDLPRAGDGATRLARVLLAADRIHFIIGLAINPAQAADAVGAVPRRQVVVEELMRELKARGKLVSVEYL
ncbi:MAG TPA: hypothetical protein ENI39_01630 [Anaerolineae bacterium]|nr:hypothetical protein [Anaerolineae bacterium]